MISRAILPLVLPSYSLRCHKQMTTLTHAVQSLYHSFILKSLCLFIIRLAARARLCRCQATLQATLQQYHPLRKKPTLFCYLFRWARVGTGSGFGTGAWGGINWFMAHSLMLIKVKSQRNNPQSRQMPQSGSGTHLKAKENLPVTKNVQH